MNKRIVGAVLILSSLTAWLTDRFTHVISGFTGRTRCGDNYMQAIDGFIGDKSCGFNDDMYLVAGLFILLLIGITFLIVDKISVRRNK